MNKIKKIILDKYVFTKFFLSGVCLKSKIISILKKGNFNINFCNIKIDNNNIFLLYKKEKFKILLKKKEINIILFFKKKKYFLLPINILKINSLFKLKLFLVKKRGIKGFDVLNKNKKVMNLKKNSIY